MCVCGGMHCISLTCIREEAQCMYTYQDVCLASGVHLFFMYEYCIQARRNAIARPHKYAHMEDTHAQFELEIKLY